MTKLVSALSDRALSVLLPKTTAGANTCWNYCGTDGNCRWCCYESNGHLQCGKYYNGCGKPYC
jgi:hypothetical protein